MAHGEVDARDYGEDAGSQTPDNVVCIDVRGCLLMRCLMRTRLLAFSAWRSPC
jgi:hypothetical protein